MADEFHYIRSMIMTEFPCPPLPKLGQRHSDNSIATMNSHDMMCTLMTTAFRMECESVNAKRREKQEQLEMRYREELAQAKTFESIYATMSTFTQRYLHTYMLHNVSVNDIRILPIEHANFALRRQIRSFTNGAAILAGNEGGTKPAQATYTDEEMRSMVVECAGYIVER